jgi:hypothetical protein
MAMRIGLLDCNWLQIARQFRMHRDDIIGITDALNDQDGLCAGHPPECDGTGEIVSRSRDWHDMDPMPASTANRAGPIGKC